MEFCDCYHGFCHQSEMEYKANVLLEKRTHFNLAILNIHECKMHLLHNCSNHRFPDPSAFLHFVHSWSDKRPLVRTQQETETELIALIKYYPNFEFFSILLSVTHAWMQPLLVFNFVMFYSYRNNRSTNTKADFVS